LDGDDSAAGVVRIEHARLVTAFTAARKLAETHDPDRALELIVRGAVTAVDGAERGGVSLSHRNGEVTSHAPTDPGVAELDGIQATLHQGPCVDAIWKAEIVDVPDMAGEGVRWPDFAPRAVELGVSSMLSIRLFTDGNILGALNLHSSRPRAFGPEASTVAELFGAHATIALSGAQHAARLNEALATRDLIGQGKGVLMQRYDIDADQAFGMLVNASQNSNMKLVEVVRWLIGNRGEIG
jgi:GAF domain-containing protein